MAQLYLSKGFHPPRYVAFKSRNHSKDHREQSNPHPNNT
jgi:hypothetical protein